MNLDVLTPTPPRNGSSITGSLKSREPIFGKRILIVEDDPILCRLIFDMLMDDDFAVNMTSDGEQAWVALHHDHYDLLVTDNEMPHLTGVELIGRIRKAGMSLPVIIASGSFSVEDVHDYPQLQITAVIPKPFTKFEFLGTVRNVFLACGDAITEHVDRSDAGLRTRPQLTELDLNLCRH